MLEAGEIAKATADSDPNTTDAARIALDFHKQIIPFQKAITAPERCLFPVIAAVHGMVVGLGVVRLISTRPCSDQGTTNDYRT